MQVNNKQTHSVHALFSLQDDHWCDFPVGLY